MVTTNTTAKKARKSNSVDPADVQKTPEELSSLLDNTELQYASYSQLLIGDLNARHVLHSDDELRGYADSIQTVGLIHNLVVVACEGGRLEVVCGGGRTRAIGLLVDDGVVDPEKIWIPFKSVPRELARAVSQIENEKRKNMHPADQIRVFRSLSEEGKTPAQIGALLGYGAKHVQRMMKLANLAPALLQMLAEDKLDVEQCQALSLENDQTRQVEVYEQVKFYYSHTPAHLLKRPSPTRKCP